MYVSSCSLLIRGNIAAVRQESHLSGCPNFPSHLSGYNSVSRFGIDDAGIAFTLSDGSHVAIYGTSSGLEFARFTSAATTGTGTVTLSSTTAPCFLRGTRIDTPQGEIAVEDIVPGTLVLTRSGTVRPVRWVGTSRHSGLFLGQDRAPVRIRAGALADGVPCRDLWVSPDHSLAIGNVLVHAGLLVNGATITQEATLDEVAYYHLDLGSPDLVMSDGAWTESYAEQNNRTRFHNVAEFEAAFLGHAATFQQLCLPQILCGDPALMPIRAAIDARIAPGERQIATCPDIHLLVDGARHDPSEESEGAWVFTVAPSQSMRLRTRASSPLMLGLNADPRRLGFRLHAVEIEGETFSIRLEAADALLSEGAYEAEQGFTWTNGDLRLPVLLPGRALRVTIRGHGLGAYLVEPAQLAA